MSEVLSYVWDNDINKWINIGGSASARIYYGTKINWNSQPLFVSENNVIYVYTDGKILTDNVGNVINVPLMKVGDGTSYLIDLPFVASGDSDETIKVLQDHINNSICHVTQKEKDFWNNKCRVQDIIGERIIFTIE